MTASNAASRKRRAAAVPSDQTDSVSNNGFDVYNLQGDAKAALTIFQKQQEQQTDDSTANNNMSLANKYNEILLLHISDTEQDIAGEESIEKLTREMNDLESDFRRADNDDDSSRTMSSRKRLRNELIFSYNRALVLLAQGRSDKALEICKDKLSEYLTMDSPPPEELVTVSSRMALLWLECILALGVSGTSEDSKALFKWLEKVESESDPQLKFLLNLYRSRFNLAELDDSGKHCDNKIRAARKELKQAMDLLQNKLRSSFGAETGSVVSSANSEENMSTQSVGRDHHETQPPQGSIVLQRHNQSALSLKAHSEQLKGNIKKSLILCSEAHVAAGSGASYDATHANNLAIVYETNNKRHLAVHALSKALRARQEQDNSSSRLFHLDGTARPDQTLLLKHNAAICSLHARNYHLAYEYMATCLVQSSGVFHSRPRSWLRLAEACIGVFSQLCELEKLSGPPNYSAIVVNA
jgi:tetratricopeptide (TPR) repeat protein